MRTVTTLPRRDNFTESTKRTIAHRVRDLCSNPKCRAPTRGPTSNPTKTTNVGDAAHITAASPGGPRYDSSLTHEQRTSPENGIWLCKTCAKRIDDDVNEYTVDKLRLWKANAEDAARDELGKPIVSLVGTARASASRNVLIQQRRNESRGRCIARWKAAGLTREQAMAFADDENIGKAPEDLWPSESCPLRILVGEFGAGKSLSGERMFQASLDTATRDVSAPVPVWLSVRDIHDDLQKCVRDHGLGIGNVELDGAFIVLDGADEVPAVQRRRIVDEARVVVETWPETRVVITSRPIPSLATAAEQIVLPELTEDQTYSLILAISKTNRLDTAMLKWPTTIRQAVARPLFAILMGVHLSRSDAPSLSSVSDLIHSAIDNAVASSPNRDLVLRYLRLIAMASVDREINPVPLDILPHESITDTLAATGVVLIHGRTAEFTLAVIAQWFAAQAILHDEVDLDTMLSDAQTIERWKYPIAIALGTGTRNIADILMERIAKKAPAIASQALRAAADLWVSDQQVEPPRTVIIAENTRQSMHVWTTGLGRNLTEMIAPVAIDNRLRQIAAGRIGNWLLTAWYHGPDTIQDINTIASVHPFIDLDSGWVLGMGASVNWAAPAWPWMRTLDELVTALEGKLNQRCFVPCSGPLFDEAAFYGASSLVNIGPNKNRPIPLASVRNALDTWGTKGWTRVGCSALVSLEAIDRKCSSLESRGEVELRPLYSGPDTWGNRKWMWGDYTDDQLLKRIRQVYDSALRGYQQLVEGWFAPLAPWLPLSAALPVRLVGKFRPMVGDSRSDQPSLITSFEPLLPSEVSAVDIQIDHAGNGWQDEDFDATTWWNRFQALRSESVADPPVMRRFSGVEVFGDSPARELAYDWLKSDLLSVAWRPLGCLS